MSAHRPYLTSSTNHRAGHPWEIVELLEDCDLDYRFYLCAVTR